MSMAAFKRTIKQADVYQFLYSNYDKYALLCHDQLVNELSFTRWFILEGVDKSGSKSVRKKINKKESTEVKK